MNQTMLDQRRAGLLVPVYALRHKNDMGIGDTRAVQEAIDFAAATGFSVLQILPIHETLGDHSPYNPISSRAHSPALLSLTPEEVPGLTAEMLEQTAPGSWVSQLRSGNVRYEVVLPLKTRILLTAAYHFFALPLNEDHEEFEHFLSENASWLEPYTLFRLLMSEYEGASQWYDWRPEHQTYESARSWILRHPHSDDLERQRSAFAFIQWISWRQWRAVREHADRQGIRLMGEMSFGVGLNSADVWANPSLFDLEWSMGTRPLSHFDTSKDAERWGQNWGFPPYRWENHRATGFAWLRDRLAGEREFFHGCRLDHLRGYFRAYMFPWPGGVRHVEFSNYTEEEAALVTGGRLPRFIPGPDEEEASAEMNELHGREIIGTIIEAADEMDLIAEIMGEMPEYMRRTLDDLELANLLFPQLEITPGGLIPPPESFRELSLVTYANHDNAPLVTLYHHLVQQAAEHPHGKDKRTLNALAGFAGLDSPPPETPDNAVLEKLQAALFRSSGRLAVLMCSDLLGIPLRFNLPGSYGRGTWSDRLELPLHDFLIHPVYGPRIAAVTRLIRETDRLPDLPPGATSPEAAPR
jgi:4-alpha-glucanotransferase